jgi:hypothetical protein
MASSMAHKRACAIGSAVHNRSMARQRINWSVVALTAILAAPVHADPVGVAAESGRTAGEAVVDSAKTVGRTIRDFFVHGPRTAGETWRSNARQTGADSRSNAERVRQEAHSER